MSMEIKEMSAESLESDYSGMTVDSEFNAYLSLSDANSEYQGGEFDFTRYDCQMKLPKGIVMLTPSDLTHSSRIRNITGGNLSYLHASFGQLRVVCFLRNGNYVCPGFERLNMDEK